VSDERARLFVALELPGDVRGALWAWAREHVGAMPRLRVVDPDSLHVTLCFLGARPAGEVQAIAAACREAVSALPAASLTVGDALWLPPRRPRVFTVELGDEGGRLAAVQAALAGALADGGFYEPEARPFLAHVTVARVQREGRPRRDEIPAPTPARFTGERVTLYRSRLGKGPARYEALASVTLSG
jgi:RNA 2',3'-cyclic 3'-phosphodiesterase